MRLTIEIPDRAIEPVKEKLPPQGVLEAVALNAVLDFILKLETDED